jgi:hypothetical protein
MKRFLESKNILWHNITLYSPWEGAFYESLIRGIKFFIRSAIGRKILSMSQFDALLHEVAEIMNERPLTFLYPDPKDGYNTLTPNHLLFGYNKQLFSHSLTHTPSGPSFPFPPTPDTEMKAQTLLQHREQQLMISKGWKAFEEMYLPALREKHSLTHPHTYRSISRLPVIGEICLLRQPSSGKNRVFWKKCKILEIEQPRSQRADTQVIRNIKIRIARQAYTNEPLEQWHNPNHIYPLEIASVPDVTIAADQPLLPEEEPEGVASMLVKNLPPKENQGPPPPLSAPFNIHQGTPRKLKNPPII